MRVGVRRLRYEKKESRVREAGGYLSLSCLKLEKGYFISIYKNHFFLKILVGFSANFIVLYCLVSNREGLGTSL